MQNYNIKVNETQLGLRLDILLSQNIPDLSRSKAQKLIKEGKVSIILNNEEITITNCKHKIKLNEEFIITQEKPSLITFSKTLDSELNILFEDEYLLVINKPAGLVVHPGAGNTENTLVHILLSKYGDNLSTLGGEHRLGIVHRLDKDTSGVLVIAKTDIVHSHLSEQFAKHTIIRNYRALVWGVINPLQGVLDNTIGRDPNNRQKMAVLNSRLIFRGKLLNNNMLEHENIPNKILPPIRGKRAITLYKTIKISPDKKFSLIDCSLKTGRTHQIRVHLSSLGHGVVADKLYGKKKNNTHIELNRHALHAYKLEFIHPVTNKLLSFEVEEDEELLNTYNKIFI